MALSIGELVAFIGLDADGFESGLNDAFAALGDKRWGTAAGAVGLAAGAALTAGLVSAIQTEGAVDKMNASLGLTGEAAARAGEVAGNLYSNAYGESMEDVTAATEAVMSSIPGMMDASAADVEGLTASVMDLATAFDLDVAEASQVAGAMMKDGLAADGTQAMDLITAAMQRVPAGVRGEILPVMSEYSKHFAGLGFTGEQAMGLIVAASADGAIGMDKAGDAVKEFQIRATDMSKTSGAAYEALGLDQEDMTAKLLAGGTTAQGAFNTIVTAIRDMDDPVAQSQAALALFGTPLEDLSADQIPAFIGSLADAGTGLQGFEGAAQQMGETLNSGAAVSIEEFKRKALMSLSGIASGAIPLLMPLVDFFTQFAPMLGPVVAVLGAVGAALWAVSTVAGAVAGALPVLTAAFGFLTGGVGLVVAVLAGLVAGVVLAYQRFETFRNIVNGAWSGIQSAVSNAWNGVILPVFTAIGSWITGTLAPALAAFGAAAAGVWSQVGAAVSNAWNGFILPALSAFGSWITGTLAPAVMGFYSGVIAPAFAAIGSTVSGAWSGFILPVLSAFGGFLTGTLAPAVTTLWQGHIVPAFSGIVAAIQTAWGVIGPSLASLGSAAASLASTVGGVLVAAFNFLAPIVMQVASVVGSVLVGAFRVVTPIVGTVARILGAVLGGAVTLAVAAVFSLAGSLIDHLGGAIRGAISFLTGLVQFVTGVFTGNWRGAWEGIKSMVSGAFQFIWNAINVLFLANALGAIRGGLAAMLGLFRGGLTSVRSVFVTAWNGILSVLRAAWSAISGVVRSGAAAMASVVRTVVSSVLGFFRNLASGMASVLRGGWNTVRSVTSAAVNAVRSLVSGWVSAVLGFFRNLGTTSGSLVRSTWNTVRSVFTGGVNAVRSLVSGWVSAVLGFFRNMGSGVRSATSNAMTTLRNLVVSGMNTARTTVSSGIDRILGFFRGMPGRITGALGNLGNLLKGAASQIMDGFLGGLKAKWEGVKSFVGGIGPWIAEHKGPKAYDLALLRPAGGWIMTGLVDSMRDEMGALDRTVSAVAGRIEGGLNPDVGVSGTMGLVSRVAPGVVDTAAVVSAVQAAASRQDDRREYVLMVDGYEFRAWTEARAADVTRRAAEHLAGPVAAYAGN